jgi:hypothetical protein
MNGFPSLGTDSGLCSPSAVYSEPKESRKRRASDNGNCGSPRYPRVGRQFSDWPRHDLNEVCGSVPLFAAILTLFFETPRVGFSLFQKRSGPMSS